MFGVTKANFCLSFMLSLKHLKYENFRESEKSRNHRTDTYAPITKMEQMLVSYWL